MRPSVSLFRQLAEQAREGADNRSMRLEWYNLHVERSTLFVDLLGQAHALTTLKIPKSWGRKWMFNISPGIGCSYALNRLLCRWFEVEKGELAIFRLQPIEPYLSAHVLGVPPNNDRLCAEVIWFCRNLYRGRRFALYPYLLGWHATTVNFLIDVLFVECDADCDIQSVEITMGFNAGLDVKSYCALLNVNTATAILLDEGSAEIAALYAVPLNAEAGLESAEDVADYLRNMLAWVDDPARGPCPGTQFDYLVHQLSKGYRCYLWGFSESPSGPC